MKGPIRGVCAPLKPALEAIRGKSIRSQVIKMSQGRGNNKFNCPSRLSIEQARYFPWSELVKANIFFCELRILNQNQSFLRNDKKCQKLGKFQNFPFFSQGRIRGIPGESRPRATTRNGWPRAGMERPICKQLKTRSKGALKKSLPNLVSDAARTNWKQVQATTSCALRFC